MPLTTEVPAPNRTWDLLPLWVRGANMLSKADMGSEGRRGLAAPGASKGGVSSYLPAAQGRNKFNGLRRSFSTLHPPCCTARRSYLQPEGGQRKGKGEPARRVARCTWAQQDGGRRGRSVARSRGNRLGWASPARPDHRPQLTRPGRRGHGGTAASL